MMKKNEYNLVQEAIETWRMNKGRGTMYLPPHYNSHSVVIDVVARLYNKNNLAKIYIIVNTFDERKLFIEELCHNNDEDFSNKMQDAIKNGRIKIFTDSYLKTSFCSGFIDLIVFSDVINFNGCIPSYLSKSNFILAVLHNKLDIQNSSILHPKAPILNVFNSSDVIEVRKNTPVEEIRIGVEIDDEEIIKELDERNNYIKTSLAIFGSFDLLKEGFQGNSLVNMSAQNVCERIAKENGWNEHLDMSIDINVQLDKLYNPNELRERASITYNVIRERNQLITDYKGKLEEINKIVNEHPDEKFIIISKRAEFATTITDYLNMYSGNQICANYHDKLENIDMLDEKGNPVLYKTGKQKGKHKTMGAQAQCTSNVNLFKANKIRALSTNSAPNKTLDVSITSVIITSPMCASIQDYLYRLLDVYIINGTLKLYTIYCKNSVEEKKLNNNASENHKIIDKNEKNIIFDESCGVIVC